MIEYIEEGEAFLASTKRIKKKTEKKREKSGFRIRGDGGTNLGRDGRRLW